MKPREDVFELVRRFMTEQIPFNAYLGIRLEAIGTGHAQLSIPFRPEFVGDPFRPALHGGVISALIDTCGGAAVWSRIGAADRVSTIDLRVDYLQPGKLEALIADGKVIRVGSRVGVVSVRVFHLSAPEQTIAEGKGVYSIKRGEKPPAAPAGQP